MSLSDAQILLSVANKIRSCLKALDFDVSAAIAAGELKVARNLPTDKKRVEVQLPIGHRLLLAAATDEGERFVVSCSNSLDYTYRAWSDDLAFVECSRGLMNARHLIDHLRHVRGATKIKPSHGKKHYYGRRLIEFTYMGQRLMVEPSALDRLHSSVLDETFLSALTDDVDAVVDLGCGAGLSLVQLALNSGRTDVQFFGADMSIHGRATLNELANVAKLSNVEAIPFDFFTPDFQFLRGFKHVLVISHRALILGKNGSREIWDRIFDTVPAVSTAMFEQASFSIPDLEQPAVIDASMAECYGFDPLFYPTILELARSGTIKVDEVVPDISGGVTLIRFSRPAS